MMKDDPSGGDGAEMATPITKNGGEDVMLIPHGSPDGSGTATKKRASRKARPGTIQVKGSSKKKSGAGSRIKKSSSESAAAKFIKYAALFLLVAQMVGLVLLMRYSRTVHDPNQPMYLASTAVFVMEVMKLVICLLVVAVQSNGALFRELYLHVIQSPMEIAKLTIPSLLYTIQNNLLYLALTNLDAATYQVCYQLKILTTALFSALLLQRKFSGQKWMSLIILTVGVAVVQISGSGDQHTTHHHHAETGVDSSAAADEQAQQQQNRVIGLIAVLCAACTSGFSGVYFEKILKGSRTSLWIRNIQMGLPSIVIAYITVYIKDGPAVQTQGFLGGYSTIVWTVVTVQAVGGLIVATVVKYADNVLKVFATSFSIVVSCIISAFLFDFHPTWMFLCGASLVVTATVMYSSPDGDGKGAKTLKVRKKASSAAAPILPTTVPKK
mmetsp:Transcript_2904/g.6188  ORF Transcript_2904/g.6188 Transcript_2904/m.6188 type:complete len:440 (+) Transcript_2904:234-1553(+)